MTNCQFCCESDDSWSICLKANSTSIALVEFGDRCGKGKRIYETKQRSPVIKVWFHVWFRVIDLSSNASVPVAGYDWNQPLNWLSRHQYLIYKVSFFFFYCIGNLPSRVATHSNVVSLSVFESLTIVTLDGVIDICRRHRQFDVLSLPLLLRPRSFLPLLRSFPVSCHAAVCRLGSTSSC